MATFHIGPYYIAIADPQGYMLREDGALIRGFDKDKCTRVKCFNASDYFRMLEALNKRLSGLQEDTRVYAKNISFLKGRGLSSHSVRYEGLKSSAENELELVQKLIRGLENATF